MGGRRKRLGGVVALLAITMALAGGQPGQASRGAEAPAASGGPRAATLSNRGFALALMSVGAIPIHRALVLFGSDAAMPADRRMRPVSDRFLEHRSEDEVRAAVHQLAAGSGQVVSASELVLLSGRFPAADCQRQGEETYCVAGVMQVPRLPFEAGRFVIAIDFKPIARRPACQGYQPVFIGEAIDWNRHFRWEAGSETIDGSVPRCRMVIFGGFPQAFSLSGDGHAEVALFVIPRDEPGLAARGLTAIAAFSGDTSGSGPAPGRPAPGR